MSRHNCVRLLIAALSALAVGLPLCGRADEPLKHPPITTHDSAGVSFTIPQAGKPTLLLFVRVDQEQSHTAVENVVAALQGAPGVQPLMVLSSKDTPEQIKKLTGGASLPIIVDPDFVMVGNYQVRVWPTTLIIMPDGKEVARLRGLPQTYARDLGAYLSFATGKIDRQALEAGLGAAHVVEDSPQQMASRHLQVAQRLLEKGMNEQARIQLEQGLKLYPQDQRLQVTMARTLLLLDQPAPAMALLEPMGAASQMPGEVGTLKGWALVEMKKWDQAIPVLRAAIRLNPNPSEAYYFLGVACQVKGQPAEAAAAFRSAYEATLPGRLLVAPEPTSATAPATKP